MNKGIVIKEGTAKVVILLTGLVTIGFMLACAPPPPIKQMPVSTWSGNYSYSYELPEKEKKAPASVKATIAIVKPSYKDGESILNTPAYSMT